jgi:hypothetical protein
VEAFSATGCAVQAEALAAGADLALGGGYSGGEPQSFAALMQAVQLDLTNASMVDRSFARCGSAGAMNRCCPVGGAGGW